MKGLTGNLTANKSLLTKWTKRGEERMLGRRNSRPGFPVHFKFKSVEEINEYLNNEKIECLLCGRSFKSLGNHLLVHDISVREYQEKYGLPYDRSLSGTIRREGLSKALNLRYKNGTFSLDHVTPEHMKRMSERSARSQTSSYKRLQDDVKMKKAISVYKKILENTPERIHCRFGHELSEDYMGRHVCKVCQLENTRKRRGHSPRAIALKTLVDSTCIDCSLPIKVLKVVNKEKCRCGPCKILHKKEYQKNYSLTRDKKLRAEQARINYRKRMDRLNEKHNSGNLGHSKDMAINESSG